MQSGKQRNLNSYSSLVLFYVCNRKPRIYFITWGKIQSIWNIHKGVLELLKRDKFSPLFSLKKATSYWTRAIWQSLFDFSYLSLSYPVLKVWKKGFHHSHFDCLVSQPTSEDIKFRLSIQRTQPIHPEVSFDILSNRYALLHYVMYFNLRKKVDSITSSSSYSQMHANML